MERMVRLRKIADDLGLLRPTEQNLEAFQNLVRDGFRLIAEEFEPVAPAAEPGPTPPAADPAPADPVPGDPAPAGNEAQTQAQADPTAT